MIFSLLFYTSLLFSNPNTSLELDCDKFREGTFESYDENRKKNIFVAITRSAGKQYEVYEPTNGKIELSVNWTSNCTYEMVYLTTTIKDVEPFIGKKLIVDIIEVDGDYYKFSARFFGLKDIPPTIGWIKKVK